MTALDRLHPEDIAAIAQQIVEAAQLRLTPWRTAKEAAAHLRCPLSRVRKLTMSGDLPHEHEGRRPMYHVDALDEFIRNGGAITP